MADSSELTVWPILHYDDTEAALRFLVGVLGFREALVARDEDGGIVHAELRWPAGGAVLFGSTNHTESIHGEMRPGASAYAFTVRDREGYLWTFGTYTGAP